MFSLVINFPHQTEEVKAVDNALRGIGLDLGWLAGLAVCEQYSPIDPREVLEFAIQEQLSLFQDARKFNAMHRCFQVYLKLLYAIAPLMTAVKPSLDKMQMEYVETRYLNDTTMVIVLNTALRQEYEKPIQDCTAKTTGFSPR